MLWHALHGDSMRFTPSALCKEKIRANIMAVRIEGCIANDDAREKMTTTVEVTIMDLETSDKAGEASHTGAGVNCIPHVHRPTRRQQNQLTP